MQNIYGVVNNEGVHIDVSNSLLGAKQYATKNKFNTVSIRYRGGYTAEKIFEKINNKWQEFNCG
jgi:hypothetical protein